MKEEQNRRTTKTNREMKEEKKPLSSEEFAKKEGFFDSPHFPIEKQLEKEKDISKRATEAWKKALDEITEKNQQIERLKEAISFALTIHPTWLPSDDSVTPENKGEAQALSEMYYTFKELLKQIEPDN